ncbi:alcohol dehydrogenase [Fomitopsis serialis]|uniref:alcohol dehydrogenase n=1 Tax=Fomitopsis serialis TaxID=139415 RepID=UPI0020080886|nr:alcohol dehydrogenase [Neoantrodia serialis]KAH9928282.1 alcohol dehydrogenase [Neoantrodia serialis]
MSPTHNTRLVLAERPTAQVMPSTFRREVVPFDFKAGPGEVLVKVEYVSIDPAMRSWLNDRRNYIEPVKIGEVMRAFGLGEVVQAGEGSGFTPGDRVAGVLGWQEYVVLKNTAVRKVVVPRGAEYLDFLGPLSMTVKPGETLVVSGAAGATGSIVCQIGKQKGAKVYAIAGSQEKCEWLEKELGVDKALNYKSPTFHDEFKKHVGFFDVFFDNVGGEILDFSLTRMKKNARIVLCGECRFYKAYLNGKPRGLTGYLNLISQRANMEGLSCAFDHADRFPAALQYLGERLQDGSLEGAPSAMNLLFTGGNTGKLWYIH